MPDAIGLSAGCAPTAIRVPLLIEVRELTDEEAFRLADIENRDRRDISDYERAVDYAEACQFYYGGHQGRMAERLEVSNAWLAATWTWPACRRRSFAPMQARRICANFTPAD